MSLHEGDIQGRVENQSLSRVHRSSGRSALRNGEDGDDQEDTHGHPFGKCYCSHDPVCWTPHSTPAKHQMGSKLYNNHVWLLHLVKTIMFMILARKPHVQITTLATVKWTA